MEKGKDMILWRSLLSLWKQLRRRRQFSRIVRLKSRDKLPDRLGKALFIIGDPVEKWVILECPCRCGERIEVNLMKSRSPHWDFVLEDGKVSLRPSLWVPSERCGSHFWITGSRINWVG